MSAFAAVTPPSRRVHLDRALMRQPVPSLWS